MLLLRLRFWVIRLVPFLERWAEAAPACCGTCPSCIGASATGVTMSWLGSRGRDD